MTLRTANVNMVRLLKNREWFADDDFPVRVERREPQMEFPPHKHEFSEIVLVTGGSGLHVVGDESIPLSAGDVFVIGGPQVHTYRNLKDLRLINVLFRPERLRLELADLVLLPGYHTLFALNTTWRRRPFTSRLRLSLRELEALLVLVDEMETELRERRPGYGFLVTALFMQMVGRISRRYGASQQADAGHLRRLAQTITQMESSAHESFKLEDLARRAQMSQRSFVRAFRAATGLSPIAYLIQLRINRAARLLRSGTERVTEIAFRVGFADSNYFARQFRQLTGVSPRAYRQRHNPQWRS
jgi:AraC-like DNA-binding protein